MLTALTFVILLSLLIFIHEFGHFLAARIVGIKVEEFAFGLPFTKPLISKNYKGVKLSLYPILFGGFVKLLGEEGEIDSSSSHTGHIRQAQCRLVSVSYKKKEKILKQVQDDNIEHAFFAKSKLERSFVILAGVFMNFLLAILVISFIFTQGVLAPTDKVKITKVLKNSPAEKAGLKVNDIILEVNKKRIKTPEELISITKKHLGEPITLTILRKGKVLGGGTKFFYPTPTKEITPKIEKEKVVEQKIFATIIPRKKYPKNEGPMGVGISNLEVKKFPFWQAPIWGTAEALLMSWQIIKGFFNMIWELVTLTTPPKDVAGPVGIVQLTSEAVKFGYLAVLQLLGMLSLNLAVINALPLPALDGGRLLFIGVEAMFGKKVKPKVEQFINNLGMALLLTLIVVITINDLNRLLNLSQIFNKIIKIVNLK